MKPLLQPSVLENLQHRMEAATRLILFINFDSVLIPQSKGLALTLEPEERDQLREFSEKNAVTLSLVSQFSLSVLKKLVGFTGIYMIANNGMEIYGPDLNVVHAEAKKAFRELEPVIQRVSGELKALPGVDLDNRGFSAVVNFSQATATVQRKARLLMEKAWTTVMDTFTLSETRYELVLSPRVGWGRNRAFLFVWNKFASPRRRPLVIYIGGDAADDDIYGMLGREGLGVLVGAAKKGVETKAGYQLKNRAEVYRFLAWLARNVSRIQAPAISS